MIGEFDLPHSRYPPAKVFKWHPSPGLTGPREYHLADKIAQHYYYQYIRFSQDTHDPTLQRSNWWADNWEEFGKFL